MLQQLLVFLSLGLLDHANAFLSTAAPAFRPTVAVRGQQWDQEIEENSRRKATGSGMGETAAGAVLGGLLLGPFGA